MVAREIGSAALVYWCRRASVNKSMRKSCVVTVAVLKGVHGVLTCTNNRFNTLDSAPYKQPRPTSFFCGVVVLVCVSDDVCLKNMFQSVVLLSKCLIGGS